MVAGLDGVRRSRRAAGDAYNFNWLLRIPEEMQRPFEVSHASMAALSLRMSQPLHERAVDLRRVFSGIVAGNVKDYGVRAIEEHGPFEISGDASIMGPLDRLLGAFVEQRRMKLAGDYRPCYRLVS